MIGATNPSACPAREKTTSPRMVVALGAVGVLAGLVIFWAFDPSQYVFFPRCMFHSMTGLDCPGCGGQRALHHVLHGQFAAAFGANALFMLLLPVGMWLLLRFALGRCANCTLPAVFLNRTCVWLLVGADRKSVV